MSSTAKKPKTPSERMSAYRERMRDKGYRQVHIWVPDSRSPSVIERARRQSAAIASTDADEVELTNWLDGVRDWPEE